MEIKKLKTDYAYTDRMNREDSPPCKHFSLRGYVAQMRQKDLRICSPFAIDGSETQPSLPPLAVPRFQSWSCNVCRGESVSDIINQRACSEGIDINNFIDLTGDSDDSESDDETAEVETTRITVPPGHLNHQLSNPVSFFHPKRTARSFRYPKVRPCPRIKDAESFFFPKTNAGSSEVRPSVTQDMHRNESGFEGNVACESEVELVISNPKGKGKSFSEVANKGKQIYEDNQSLQELRKSCTLQGNVIVIADEEDVEPEAEQFPQVPVTEDNVHAEHSDKNGESGVVVLDHHQQKNTGNSSKKFKRMRLLREILGEDDEPKTEQIRIERTAPQNPSVHSEPEKTIMNEEVGEGDAKKLEKKGQRGRKRKLILDEDDIPLSMIFPRAENDAPNMPTSPLAQVAPNEEGLGEGLHQSSNNSPQTENEHTLPMPIQKGQGGETDSDGERRSAISRQGKGVRIEVSNSTNPFSQIF
ncbi:unnamed protein product [Sphenostylis stenocarpa]|uniref:Uncharacterized protein n=1 Tax=Sphenostylis stenocarpa TaxID=92480 RepID=A0AA86ST93_9FABA|nr:unnamed protein product [Sphenostylis stenocarpa]